MFTFGPRPDKLTREEVEGVGRAMLGANLKHGRIAFETSEQGYKHVHFIVQLQKETKVPMTLVKQFKKLCHEDEAGRKPNCAVNYVPR